MIKKNEKNGMLYPEVLVLTGAGISIPIGIPAMRLANAFCILPKAQR